MVLGTVPYMSPEQVEGRTVDARSDIFSFGAVLYQMVTGQRAFADDAARSAAARILSDDPPPVHQHAPAVPAELAAIVARCLRKDLGRRYQYIADVKVALEDVLEEHRSAPQAQRALASCRGDRYRHCYWWRPSSPPRILHRAGRSRRSSPPRNWWR